MQQGSFAGAGGGLEPLAEQGVDRRVDAADEEAGHAGHVAQVAALGGAFLEPGDVGARHLLVSLLREQQRDVDVDPFADQWLDRRNAFGRRRHFDHDVRPVDLPPQPAGLGERPGGVARQIEARPPG